MAYIRKTIKAICKFPLFLILIVEAVALFILAIWILPAPTERNIFLAVMALGLITIVIIISIVFGVGIRNIAKGLKEEDEQVSRLI